MTPVFNAGKTGEVSYPILVSALGILVVILFVVSVLMGKVAIPISVLAELFAEEDTANAVIIRELRFPRAILALAIGAALGVAGAALQGLLRNPLAEPGLIGVSGTAALGAVIAFYSGLSVTFPFALPAGGMIGAVISVVLLYILAGRDPSILTLILADCHILSRYHLLFQEIVRRPIL